ncbi:phosphoribosylformylglycinamidine synthase, purS [Methanocaldococcus vulcanius M7]|uniref:Phosphoribosylformylglycinamidine synthase subunit PurS n=1 Tax=Methanocaldococcus vulcanius (strain ATCC 700851 / DSM 12094 / M7) TaxID=579137 RepID=C9RE00_METVM|nr:phosphoribosylformylglycinamidine synthase subunit PurS [Methanocaldococcus vulcanius]ACX73529.1 phosphoribosylformylglycinamidine synthase, purS [Methanocaldococcus vulcanius M7]
MYKATVIIKLKKGVLNPEGRTINRALNFLGFNNVKDVQTYKMIDMIIEGDSKEEIEKEVEEMCKKLLANPVIHDYEIKIEKIE